MIPLNLIHPTDRDKWEKEAVRRDIYYHNKYTVAKQAKPKIIAEIGVRAGYSAWCFMQAAPDATYYGFDNDKGAHGGVKGMCEWAECILSPYKRHIRTDFDTQTNCWLIDENGKRLQADFVHVDGDHSYNGCRHDLVLAVLTGAPFVLVDDYDYIPSVKKAVDDACKFNLFNVYHITDMKGQALLIRKGTNSNG